MNIVADDILVYINIVGREIRLGRLFSYEEEMTPVS
jgi:hypothetical protein